MSLIPQNKGIIIVGLMTVSIIAAIQKEWGIVSSVITGAFALLNLEK